MKKPANGVRRSTPTSLPAFTFAMMRRCGFSPTIALWGGDVFVPKTVILEGEWVLRYVADQPEGKVLECLEHLIALPGITVEDRDEIEAALGHCRERELTLPTRCTLLPAKPAASSSLMFADSDYVRPARKASP